MFLSHANVLAIEFENEVEIEILHLLNVDNLWRLQPQHSYVLTKMTPFHVANKLPS